MARKTKGQTPEDEFDKDYVTSLLIRRNKEGMKKYNQYLREHNARLRRLEREARGESVPSDYDCPDGAYE